MLTKKIISRMIGGDESAGDNDVMKTKRLCYSEKYSYIIKNITMFLQIIDVHVCRGGA